MSYWWVRAEGTYCNQRCTFCIALTTSLKIMIVNTYFKYSIIDFWCHLTQHSIKGYTNASSDIMNKFKPMFFFLSTKCYGDFRSKWIPEKPLVSGVYVSLEVSHFSRGLFDFYVFFLFYFKYLTRLVFNVVLMCQVILALSDLSEEESIFLLVKDRVRPSLRKLVPLKQ